MSLPQVVIVGRPNVGKSSLFNWLVGRRLAIVDDFAGVTRDRLIQPVEHAGRWFELVDTGGIGIEDADDLTEEVERQIQIGLDEADVILFVVDTRTGPVPLDQTIAERLRRADRPIVLVANKTDADSHEPATNDFARLGYGSPIATSTTQNRGRDELLAAILEHLPPDAMAQPDADPEMKIAIVGRRNVGKSTFVNTLLQTERMIVSDVPGTTRDSVDVRFELDGKSFVAIDTPGVKRASRLQDDLEFYSLHRAQRAIRHADVALVFFDAADLISKLEKQLVSYVEEQGKPCIFVANKWDLLVDKTGTRAWADYIHDEFPTMTHVPVAFITGKTGKNVKTLLNHARMLFKQSRERVDTADLNRIIEAALERNPPPIHRHRRPKIFYATQVDVAPPTIVLFCNDPRSFAGPYRRYLLNYLRDELKFAEVPIRLYFRRRGEREEFSRGGAGLGKGES